MGGPRRRSAASAVGPGVPRLVPSYRRATSPASGHGFTECGAPSQKKFLNAPTRCPVGLRDWDTGSARAGPDSESRAGNTGTANAATAGAAAGKRGAFCFCTAVHRGWQAET
jgi:hypothetical protein